MPEAFYITDIPCTILAIHKIRAASMKAGQGYTQEKGRPGDCLIYIISGSAAYTTEQNETFRLQKGEVLFLKRGLKYQSSVYSDDYAYIFVEFELETSEKNVHNQKISDENGRFEPLFRRLIETDVQKKAGYDVKCMSVLYEIYYEMIRCKQERGAVSFRHPQIERICYDMQQKFKNPDYKVSGAARKAGISDVYFRRLFKEELGMSPLQYLITLRIAHAKNLITYEKKSVSEVASESGFSDIYYFSRMFKKATGFTPTEYRRYVNAY